MLPRNRLVALCIIALADAADLVHLLVLVATEVVLEDAPVVEEVVLVDVRVRVLADVPEVALGAALEAVREHVLVIVVVLALAGVPMLAQEVARVDVRDVLEAALVPASMVANGALLKKRIWNRE